MNNLDLPFEIEERFEELAQLKGTQKNALIIAALEEWLDDNTGMVQSDEVTRFRSGINKILTSGVEHSKQKYFRDINNKTQFSLPSEKWDAFIKALDSPANPNKTLANLLVKSAPWER